MTETASVSNPILSEASDPKGGSTQENAGKKHAPEVTDDSPISGVCPFFGSLPACIVLSFCVHIASYGALGSFDGRMNLAAELICYCIILFAFGLTAIVLTWLITFCVARFALITEENLLRLNENLYQGTLSVISGLQVGMVKLQKGLEAIGQTPKIVYNKLGGLLLDATTYTSQLPTTLWYFITMSPSSAANKDEEEEDDIKAIPLGNLCREEEVIDTVAIEDIETQNQDALKKYKKSMQDQRDAIESKRKAMDKHWESATYTQR